MHAAACVLSALREVKWFLIKGMCAYAQFLWAYLYSVHFKLMLFFDSLCLCDTDVPEFWADQDGEFKLITLDPQSDEYFSIAATFLQTLPQKTITRIERIQNKPLWRRYLDSAKRMAEFNNNMINEKTLFHGTSQTPPEAIYEGSRSFDITFSNNGLWGRGNYFAANASYSYYYAYREGGYRFMLVANVLTGFAYDTGRNCQRFNQPPLRTDGVGQGQIRHSYDCVTGETGGSKVYITYDNEKAYPAYLIAFQ